MPALDCTRQASMENKTKNVIKSIGEQWKTMTKNIAMKNREVIILEVLLCILATNQTQTTNNIMARLKIEPFNVTKACPMRKRKSQVPDTRGASISCHVKEIQVSAMSLRLTGNFLTYFWYEEPGSKLQWKSVVLKKIIACLEPSKAFSRAYFLPKGGDALKVSQVFGNFISKGNW